MTTEMKTVAGLVSCVIWADGKYEETEKDILEEIAEALEYDLIEFSMAVDKELAVIQPLSEEEVNKYLKETADKVTNDEVGIVLEVAMQMAISDNVFSIEESEVIHAIADALGITPAMTTLLVSDMVKTETELEVSFE